MFSVSPAKVNEAVTHMIGYEKNVLEKCSYIRDAPPSRNMFKGGVILWWRIVNYRLSARVLKGPKVDSGARKWRRGGGKEVRRVGGYEGRRVGWVKRLQCCVLISVRPPPSLNNRYTLFKVVCQKFSSQEKTHPHLRKDVNWLQAKSILNFFLADELVALVVITCYIVVLVVPCSEWDSTC